MRSLMRVSVRTSVLAVLMCSVLVASVWAYIPPATFILHTLAKKHTGFTTIRVRSMVTALDSHGAPTGAKFRETTVFNSREHKMTSWATDDAGTVLYVVQRHSASGTKMPIVPEVLFDSNSGRMTASIKAAGIPVAQGADKDAASGGDHFSLRRWNRSVAWVMGQNSQLWIEKDTFVPVRIVAPAITDSDLFDFQMESFRFYDDFSYPRVATLFQADNKKPLLKAEMTETALDAVTTDIPKEKAEGFTSAGRDAPSQVRDLLQSYYRFVR